MSISTATPPSDSRPRDDAALADHAVAVLDAALSSASVDVIGVSQWWERATSALVSAAAAGSAWPRIVSTLARKLQIDVIGERDSRTLAALGAQLDEATLGRWCYLANRDAPYVVAMCRIRRADRHPSRKTSPPAQLSQPSGLGLFDTPES